VPESAVPGPLSSSLTYIRVGHDEILGYGTTAPIFYKIIKGQLWQYYTASIHYGHTHIHLSQIILLQRKMFSISINLQNFFGMPQATCLCSWAWNRSTYVLELNGRGRHKHESARSFICECRWKSRMWSSFHITTHSLVLP
jgi:hypothetical protein